MKIEMELTKDEAEILCELIAHASAIDFLRAVMIGPKGLRPANVAMGALRAAINESKKVEA